MAATARKLRRWAERWLRRYLNDPTWRVLLHGRILRRYWRFRFHAFGEHSVLYKPSWLYGAHKISIGRGTHIFMCWLAVERTAWGRPAPVLSIGDRVAMRPYSTVSAAESVVIEDEVGIASHSLVIDSDHVTLPSGRWFDEETVGRSEDFDINPVVLSSLETSPVRIGRGTWVGERVAVLRGANIGRYCVIGTNSVVRGEIPDYSIAVGAPARVVGSTRSVDQLPGEKRHEGPRRPA